MWNGGKKNIAEVINKLLDPTGNTTKYLIPQGSKIIQIYEKKGLKY